MNPHDIMLGENDQPFRLNNIIIWFSVLMLINESAQGEDHITIER